MYASTMSVTDATHAATYLPFLVLWVGLQHVIPSDHTLIHFVVQFVTFHSSEGICLPTYACFCPRARCAPYACYGPKKVVCKNRQASAPIPRKSSPININAAIPGSSRDPTKIRHRGSHKTALSIAKIPNPVRVLGCIRCKLWLMRPTKLTRLGLRSRESAKVPRKTSRMTIKEKQ